MQNNVAVETMQSNDALVICEAFEKAPGLGCAGIVFNPSGFIRQEQHKDKFHAALKASGLPCVEVHYTNPLRTLGHSPIAPACTAVVFGFGVDRYACLWALRVQLNIWIVFFLEMRLVLEKPVCSYMLALNGLTELCSIRSSL